MLCLDCLFRKEDIKIRVKLIACNSPEFQQAAQLRYDLFFAEHNLPRLITQHSSQVEHLHFAILHENTVIAYAQLVPKSDRKAYLKGNRVYQICQMVVQSRYQGRGLGKKILLFSIAEAKKDNATSLILNARLTAVEFY